MARLLLSLSSSMAAVRVVIAVAVCLSRKTGTALNRLLTSLDDALPAPALYIEQEIYYHPSTRNQGALAIDRGLRQPGQSRVDRSNDCEHTATNR
ncbi:hypothetical protein [Burkholderia pseudomultivorans]|uniref:hypothetical protein n=1 Tax=Burkholderia pseudomultivorans TaxID=1207504 RepID=UPI0012D8E599|nr:hypothetical protein [Burkholderia pseudomultivorans]